MTFKPGDLVTPVDGRISLLGDQEWISDSYTIGKPYVVEYVYTNHTMYVTSDEIDGYYVSAECFKPYEEEK